jgi:hypothetical protein
LDRHRFQEELDVTARLSLALDVNEKYRVQGEITACYFYGISHQAHSIYLDCTVSALGESLLLGLLPWS